MSHRRKRAIGMAMMATLLWGCQESVSGLGPGPSAGPAIARDYGVATRGGSSYGYYLAARIAQADNDVEAAADFYAVALRSDPDDPEVLRRALAAFVIDGQVERAIEAARRLVELGSDPGGAQLTLAVADVASGDYASANERLKNLPRVGFNALLAPLLEAWTEIGLGDLEAARDSIRSLSSNAAFKPIFDYHMALMSDLVGLDMAAAESYRASASSLDGGSIRVVQAAGAFFERTGRPEDARALYLRYLDANPESTSLDAALRRIDAGTRPERVVADARAGFAEALYGIAAALYQENAHDAALTYGQLALHLRHDLDVASLLIGDIHAASGRDAIAVRSYTGVSQESTVAWPAAIRLAASYERIDRIDEAITRLQALADERPERIDALVSLGEILRSHERYDEAIAVYDRALARVDALEPRHWSMLYARGMSHERVGAWPSAERDFFAALDLAPEQPFVLNYLGYSWVEQGVRLEEAHDMIARAVAQRPTDGYIVDSLGWVHYQLGNYGEAVRHLERATELRPHDPVIIDHFADALWRAGRREEARFQWKRALSFDPETDLAETIERKVRIGLDEITPSAVNQPDSNRTEL